MRDESIFKCLCRGSARSRATSKEKRERINAGIWFKQNEMRERAKEKTKLITILW